MKKEVRFQMLMTQEEKILLQEMAARYGFSMAFLLRYLIRLHARRIEERKEMNRKNCPRG